MPATKLTPAQQEREQRARKELATRRSKRANGYLYEPARTLNTAGQFTLALGGLMLIGFIPALSTGGLRIMSGFVLIPSLVTVAVLSVAAVLLWHAPRLEHRYRVGVATRMVIAAQGRGATPITGHVRIAAHPAASGGRKTIAPALTATLSNQEGCGNVGTSDGAPAAPPTPLMIEQG